MIRKDAAQIPHWSLPRFLLFARSDEEPFRRSIVCLEAALELSRTRVRHGCIFRADEQRQRMPGLGNGVRSGVRGSWRLCFFELGGVSLSAEAREIRLRRDGPLGNVGDDSAGRGPAGTR